MRRRVVLESWEEMKEKLTEEYRLEYYRNHFLDKLHNFRQGHMSVHDCIAIFKDLTRYYDTR